jgi:hypothetical protein
MSDEQTKNNPSSGDIDPNKKRRRRRRRKRGGSGGGGGDNRSSSARAERAPIVTEIHRKGGRRQSVEFAEPMVTAPASGKNPYKKRGSRPRRAAPKSATGRKRRLNKEQAVEAAEYLITMPEGLLAMMYKGLGGQPHRVPNHERMVQLTVKALTSGNRIAGVLAQIGERERKALSALVHSGGIAHAEEFHRELHLSFSQHTKDWHRAMQSLANRGLIFASVEQDGAFFYLLPPPLLDALVDELAEDLGLPMFTHDDVTVLDEMPFCPPLEFSITSLAAYIDQSNPRFSQRQELYRQDKETMDLFFKQVWDGDSELFQFHLDFLMMHRMVELRGEYLCLNSDVMEEWLQLEAEDQRDLLFRALDKRFSLSEWVLWAIHAATQEDPTGWVAERPLEALYRRWKRGEDWRARFDRNSFTATRTSERESFSFAPLVRAGILDMGRWGQEKFYRLSARGRSLLEPSKDEGFQQFYLTPSFEIMAPAGIAPILLFRIGELANLVGCDRANTYKITDTSIERALERGWRRDDVLQFLRDNSQIGLPENVEQTLKGWIGHRGDVEFHDLMMLTVHRSQIRRFESNKKVKSYLLHRFAPGLYAIDRSRRDEVQSVLADIGFHPSSETRNYPGDADQVDARQNLHRLVRDARETITDPMHLGKRLVIGDKLMVVPGTKSARKAAVKRELPPKVTVEEVRVLADQALSKGLDLEIVYRTNTGQNLHVTLQPQRFAFKSEAPVLVGLDRDEGAARTYLLDRIERMQVIT